MQSCMLMGNIGCGKSTWLKALSTRGLETVCEDLNEVVFLSDYWKSGCNAFHTQIGFYTSWFKLYNKAQKRGGAVIDGSILSHHHIFTKYMADNHILNDKEYTQCCKLFDTILDTVDCRCVFLYCDLEENKRRIISRNRVNEINNDTYISLLKDRFDVLYENNKSSITKVDITKLTPHKNIDFLAFHNLLKIRE